MRQALPRQFKCLGPIRSAPHVMSFPTQYETPPREEVMLTIDEQDSVHPGPPSVYALCQLVRPTSKTCSRREPLTGGVTPCLRFGRTGIFHHYVCAIGRFRCWSRPSAWRGAKATLRHHVLRSRRLAVPRRIGADQLSIYRITRQFPA
jgi:hypothetical protein